GPTRRLSALRHVGLFRRGPLQARGGELVFALELRQPRGGGRARPVRLGSVQVEALAAVGGFRAQLLQVVRGSHAPALPLVRVCSARTPSRSPIWRSRATASGSGRCGLIV